MHTRSQDFDIAQFWGNMLENKIIQPVEWLPCSPDIKPIQHVLEILGEFIAARPMSLFTIQTCSWRITISCMELPQSYWQPYSIHGKLDSNIFKYSKGPHTTVKILHPLQQHFLGESVWKKANFKELKSSYVIFCCLIFCTTL